MTYVDGFVVPVLAARLDDYKKMAKLGAKVWIEHGALDYREFVADDVKPGKTTSFPQAVKLKEGEIVVFSHIVYKSRAHRDKVNKLVMADPRMATPPGGTPFDMKRMFFGGFKALVEATAKD
jgi:uncharacterized protein YbaA (DUF1428 family)